MLLMERVLPVYPDAVVVLGMMTLDIDRAHLRLRDAEKPSLMWWKACWCKPTRFLMN